VFCEIVSDISFSLIQTQCLQLIQTLSDPSERLLSRKLAARIVSFLAKVCPLGDYMKVFMPYLKKMAEDENWEVRKVVAEGIPSVCETFEDSASREVLYDIVINII